MAIFAKSFRAKILKNLPTSVLGHISSVGGLKIKKFDIRVSFHIYIETPQSHAPTPI